MILDSNSIVTGFAALIVLFLLLFLYKHIVHPRFISPISQVPVAHWSSRFCSLWILWIRYKECEVQTIYEAHQRLGPVVRLAPNEISVNCVKGGIQPIYAGGFEKHEWYSHAFIKHGCFNMFSTLESRPHSIRKRMVSNIYSKSYLHNSAPLSAVTKSVLYDRLLPHLETYSNRAEVFNIFDVINAATFDYAAGYLFGVAASRKVASMLENSGMFKDFFTMHNDRGNGHRWFYIQELNRLTVFLSRFGFPIVPPIAQTAFDDVEHFGIKLCDAAEATLKKYNAVTIADMPDDTVGDFPTVYAQLKSSLEKNSSKDNGLLNMSDDIRLQIASELTDEFLAGFETSGITLTYFAHEISKRPDLQAELRKELLTLEPAFSFQQIREGGQLPSPKALDSLPLLQSLLQETLRLHAAIPGPQPRITPAGGCTLGPEGEYGKIPGGVRISAQAWNLHRNVDVFPEPESWKPERWLNADEEKLREMNRWFWAFGSGGRMCAGSNLAIYQMKHIAALIWTNFRTVIVDDEGIEQEDAYTAPPKGRKLMVRLEALES